MIPFSNTDQLAALNLWVPKKSCTLQCFFFCKDLFRCLSVIDFHIGISCRALIAPATVLDVSVNTSGSKIEHLKVLWVFPNGC